MNRLKTISESLSKPVSETVVAKTWAKIEKLESAIGQKELFENLIKQLDDDSVNAALDNIARECEVKL